MAVVCTIESVGMGTPLYWAVRDGLDSTGRRRVRAAVDAVLAPVLGSVKGAVTPTGVAITFDDGPDPLVTPLLLAALEELAVRCTFFVLARQSRQYPDILRAVRDGGHEIALHGDDHRRLTDLGHRDALRYLLAARQEVEQLIGVPVRRYRPPYGALSVPTYLAARRAGLEVVVWSADAADWHDRPVSNVVDTGLGALVNGGILLLHERLEPGPLGEQVSTTFDRVTMARAVIDGVRARGWRPTTVADLVATGRAKRTAWLRP